MKRGRDQQQSPSGQTNPSQCSGWYGLTYRSFGTSPGCISGLSRVHALTDRLRCIAVTGGKTAVLKGHDSEPAGGHGGGAEHGQNSETSDRHGDNDQLKSTVAEPC